MTEPTQADQPFEFDRYVNGELMAEGITVEKQETLAAAMRVASRLASKGPNGETPVLVLASTAALSKRVEELEAENAEMRRHWTFLSSLFDGHVVENDEPHRVKLEDGWHTGPLADHHVRTMLAIRKLAKAALGGDHVGNWKSSLPEIGSRAKVGGDHA